MFFHQRPASNATLSYLFGCAGVGRSVAVDVVAGDEDWFVDEAARSGVPIGVVIDTHVHADQRGLVIGLNEFAGVTGYAASLLGPREGLLWFGGAVIELALLLARLAVAETLPWRWPVTPRATPRRPNPAGE